MNKMLKRVSYMAVIGLLGLAVVAAFTRQTNAQTDLKQMLAGESSKQWQLKELKTKEKDLKEEDFDADHEFASKNEAAQLVPDIIVFHADGTCEMTYVSQYKDGHVVEDNYKVNGKWSIEGDTVEIIENANGDNKLEESRDEVFWLKDVVMTKSSFKCKFSLQGDYTGGVEELDYETQEASASNAEK